MGNPRAITYKEVSKAVGEPGAAEAWRKVGEITGAGHVPVDQDGNAAIDITELSDAKTAQIDKLLSPAEPEKAQKGGSK